MRNVPAYLTGFASDASSMMYPHIPTMVPPTMKYPLFLTLSEKWAVKMTTTNPVMLGGTVNSWAVVEVYPMPAMMEGRKREKL